MNLSNDWLGSRGTLLSKVGEFGLITQIRTLIDAETAKRGLDTEHVVIGIGDDAASLRPTPGFESLVTCDIQVSGRHFDPAWISPGSLGKRCATVNLSDIAAMGGIPRAAIVSLAIGPEPSVEDIEEIYRGMIDRFAEHKTVLVGGNVSGLGSGLIVDITLMGEVESGRAIRRDSAETGDLVWVTGSPGSARAGLEMLMAHGDSARQSKWSEITSAYLSPIPRVREGRALGESKAVSSMIDLSDGLTGDLHHLVEGRDVGILLREESLPIGDELMEAARELGCSAESLILGPSDDYELIFTAAPESAERAVLAVSAVSDVAVWPIGEVISGAPGSVLIEDANGNRHEAPAGGWNHISPQELGE